MIARPAAPRPLPARRCLQGCAGESAVLETREAADGSLRRRRSCLVCGGRWTTIEVRAANGRVITLPAALAHRLRTTALVLLDALAEVALFEAEDERTP